MYRSGVRQEQDPIAAQTLPSSANLNYFPNLSEPLALIRDAGQPLHCRAVPLKKSH